MFTACNIIGPKGFEVLQSLTSEKKKVKYNCIIQTGKNCDLKCKTEKNQICKDAFSYQLSEQDYKHIVLHEKKIFFSYATRED